MNCPLNKSTISHSQLKRCNIQFIVIHCILCQSVASAHPVLTAEKTDAYGTGWLVLNNKRQEFWSPGDRISTINGPPVPLQAQVQSSRRRTTDLAARRVSTPCRQRYESTDINAADTEPTPASTLNLRVPSNPTPIDDRHFLRRSAELQ